MGAGDWSPTTTRPVCRINRDSLSLKGPLNDLQEWRALRDANSRLSRQGKSILRNFQLRSCRKQAFTLTTRLLVKWRYYDNNTILGRLRL
jgi:hypothetical protein